MTPPPPILDESAKAFRGWMDRLGLNVSTAAGALGVSRPTIRAAMKDGPSRTLCLATVGYSVLHGTGFSHHLRSL
jgi:hypothetical protein